MSALMMLSINRLLRVTPKPVGSELVLLPPVTIAYFEFEVPGSGLRLNGLKHLPSPVDFGPETIVLGGDSHDVSRLARIPALGDNDADLAFVGGCLQGV
jgi:hypothetical protein